MKAIIIEQLNKTYSDGTKALTDVNLEIEAGEFFGLIGANGAGKTTIIGILTGLVNKTSGKASIFGKDIDTHFDQARKFIGVVPQEFNFNVFEKVQDIILTQAGYFGITRQDAASRCEELLKKLNLWHKHNTVSRSLSGGMKRRLMIARALIHQPQLLILDEPTAGVDVELRHEMWEYLRILNQEGLTILLTTHYLEEVEQMCRNAAIIKDGQIIKHDRVSRLVQVFEKETYVVTVDVMKELDMIKDYNPVVTDENTFEVELSRKEGLHNFLEHLSQSGMVMTDIRAKGHRLEKLFLSIMREGRKS